MTDDFSKAEFERLTTAVDRLTETIVNLERRMAETYVRQDVYERERQLDAAAGESLANQVSSLVSLKDWAIKLVLGAVILGLVALLFASNGGPPA